MLGFLLSPFIFYLAIFWQTEQFFTAVLKQVLDLWIIQDLFPKRKIKSCRKNEDLFFKFLGERLIQFATEHLVTEVLIQPQMYTLQQCVKNMLGSFTKHRHVVHGGYTFSGSGKSKSVMVLTSIKTVQFFYKFIFVNLCYSLSFEPIRPIIGSTV